MKKLWYKAALQAFVILAFGAWMFGFLLPWWISEANTTMNIVGGVTLLASLVMLVDLAEGLVSTLRKIKGRK